MKRKYMIPLLLVIAMLLAACQPGGVNTIAMDSAGDLVGKTDSTETTVPSVTDPTETTQPADRNVEKFQTMLQRGSIFDAGNWYLQALNGEYKSVTEMNLAHLFYNGFKDESSEPTEAEIEYLNSTGRFMTEWQCLDFFRLPVEKMDAVLQKYFGITFEQANQKSLDQFVYWEETNCYYDSHSGAMGHAPVVTAVEKLNYGRVAVSYYDRNNLEKFVLMVQENSDGYRVLSNLAVLDGDEEAAMKETLNNVFNNGWYSHVLGAEFASPEFVALSELFSCGILGKNNELTEHEKEVLVKMGFNLNLDTVKMSADEMDEVLKEYLGIGLDEVDVNGFRNLVYLESTGCWYQAGVYRGCEQFEASHIGTDGNGYYFVSYFGNLRKGMMELEKKDGGGYNILSNQYEFYNPET